MQREMYLNHQAEDIHDGLKWKNVRGQSSFCISQPKELQTNEGVLGSQYEPIGYGTQQLKEETCRHMMQAIGVSQKNSIKSFLNKERARHLFVDGHYKIAPNVRLSDGSRPYKMAVIGMNEHGRVALAVVATTKKESGDETLNTEMKNFVTKNKEDGCQVKTLTTDTCCGGYMLAETICKYQGTTCGTAISPREEGKDELDICLDPFHFIQRLIDNDHVNKEHLDYGKFCSGFTHAMYKFCEPDLDQVAQWIQEEISKAIGGSTGFTLTQQQRIT